MIKPHQMDERMVGRRRYGSGQANATAGAVDPTGYVGRGLRSGLAKAILHGPQHGAHTGVHSGRDPAQLVGETAHRMAHGAANADPAALARILRARRRGAHR